jgi:hypothetical protein
VPAGVVVSSSNSRAIATMGLRDIWDHWIIGKVNDVHLMREKKRLSHNHQIPLEREIND